MTLSPASIKASLGRVCLASCWLALSILLASCSTMPEKTASLDGVNFASTPPAEILDLLRHAENIKVDTAVGAGLDEYWLRHLKGDIQGCNGGQKYGEAWRREDLCFGVFGLLHDQALKGPTNNADLVATMSALMRGCGIYAISSDEAEKGRTCGNLGKLLFEIGNAEAARTVWEQAPGCYSQESRTGLPVNGCVPVMLNGMRVETIYESAPQRLRAIMEKSCNTVHDEDSCTFLQTLGVKVDMNAVASAQAEYHEAVQASREKNLAVAAKDQADSENRRNALLGALQSMPGATDPNAILSAGNQQAATIRGIGDANAARQQQDARLRLASQRATLQTTSQGTNVVAGPTTTSQSSAQVVTSSPSAQSNVSDSNSSVASGAIQYSTPLATSCVRQFFDPNTYNWLSFENNCGQAIYINYIPHRPGGWAMGGGMHLAPGNHNNTGLSSAEINQTGGFDLYVCPTNAVPVDLSGNAFNTNVAQYRCKPQ